MNRPPGRWLFVNAAFLTTAVFSVAGGWLWVLPVLVMTFLVWILVEAVWRSKRRGPAAEDATDLLAFATFGHVDWGLAAFGSTAWLARRSPSFVACVFMAGALFAWTNSRPITAGFLGGAAAVFVILAAASALDRQRPHTGAGLREPAEDER